MSLIIELSMKLLTLDKFGALKAEQNPLKPVADAKDILVSSVTGTPRRFAKFVSACTSLSISTMRLKLFDKIQ